MQTILEGDEGASRRTDVSGISTAGLPSKSDSPVGRWSKVRRITSSAALLSMRPKRATLSESESDSNRQNRITTPLFIACQGLVRLFPLSVDFHCRVHP